jgi:hypothetical protein
MFRSLLSRILLITALLFGQLGVLTHGISHALAEQGSEQSLPHDKHCDLCAAYAQIGSAIGSGNIVFVSSDTHFTPASHYFTTHASDAFVAFAARAPPYSV